ncbi:MAG: ParB/RepB/Spo0J family partition protein [Patescibacteria group bacterium]
MDNLKKYQSVFWIEVDKIKPNPMQPRAIFNEEKLQDLSESIRQYGVLQPLIVNRKEMEVPSGTIVEYELIVGERRLRAARMAGLNQVPVIIREDTEDKLKLELAIIENLQREDLNPLERARAFKKLIETFNLKHQAIADRIGKSRVFVTNTLRLLKLPEEMQTSLKEGILSEGHMRPLLMLAGRKEAQMNLFKSIVETKMSVRETERLSRIIARERARKKELSDAETQFLENQLSERLGTKVQIEKYGEKRRISIDFFSNEELEEFIDKILSKEKKEQDFSEDNDELIDNFTV